MSASEEILNGWRRDVYVEAKRKWDWVEWNDLFVGEIKKSRLKIDGIYEEKQF